MKISHLLVINIIIQRSDAKYPSPTLRRIIVLVYTTQVNSQSEIFTLFSANGQNAPEAKRQAILFCSVVNSTNYPTNTF